MKKADLITGGVFAVFSFLVIGASSRLPASSGGVPGSGTWPIIIAVIMLFASGAIMLQALKNRSTDNKKIGINSPDSLRVYAVMGMLSIYFGMMYVIGFCTATFAMLFIFIKRFGNGKWYKTAGIACMITAAVYGVFKYVLKVPFRFGFLF